jgi:hypothetical protein
VPIGETKLHDLPGRAGGAGSTGLRQAGLDFRAQDPARPGSARTRRVETGTRSERQEEGYMHNQHAGQSQLLAEQRITQRQEQAAQPPVRRPHRVR